MYTSQFMDKQIMDLSNSQSKIDFIDLMNPREDHIGGGGNKEEIVPSYDFQPIHPIGISSQPFNIDSNNVGGTRAWNSADSKANTTGSRNYGSLDSMEPAKVTLETGQNVFDAALVSEIDRTMKKHADNLLHVLEGVSARISQLESRTRHLENSVDDLKVSVGNNFVSNDGKMRQIENILREVQTGVHVIRDKQEIMEAELKLAKLQVSNGELQTETQNTLQPPAAAPQQSHQQFSPIGLTRPPLTVPPPNATPPPPQQNLPPPGQLMNQFSHNQIPSVPQQESYFPPPCQMPEIPNQRYQIPPPQQLQPSPPAPPKQQYQPSPHPQYSQPPAPPQQHQSLSAVNPPQPPLVHHPEETSYVPSQIYPPGIQQPPSHPPSGAPPLQQFYGTASHMYEPPSSRPSSGFSGSYGPSSVPGEQYPYSGSPSQYGGGSPKKPQQLSSAMGYGGGSGYPQLPSARILPRALPTSSGVGGGSGSTGTGNRVPVDDVIDKVMNMGFPRDQVRATVQKLTENGQAVDLNVVLDKLMNDGEGQPQRGWFGR